MKKLSIVVMSICMFSCNSQKQKSSSDVTITDSTSNITVVNTTTNSNVVIDSSNSVQIVSDGDNSVNVIINGDNNTIDQTGDDEAIEQNGPSQTTVNGKQYKSKTGSVRIENNKVIIDGKVVDTIH